MEAQQHCLKSTLTDHLVKQYRVIYIIGIYFLLLFKTHVEQHKGSSVNQARQEAAHVHAVAFESNNLFVVDLGIDAVVQCILYVVEMIV